MSHKRKLKRAVIKEELVALTGDAFQAVILNRLIELTYERYEFDKMLFEEKARAESIGRSIRMQPTNGWIYKKAEELADEIMIIDSTRTVRKKISELVEKGYLLEKNSEIYRFERTKQYKVDIDKLSRELNNIGYKFDMAIGI